MITFRQLEALKSVIEAGSVVKAAEIMRRSQPAISRLLSDLESAVGYGLFERRKGRLTPRGEAWELYAEVDRSFVGLGRIIETAERIGRRKSTHLRLVALPAFTTGPLPGVVAQFLDRHPEVFISLESRTRPQILEGLADGMHDIGLASMPIDGPDVGVRPLLSTECVCLVPADHRLSGYEVVRPADLDGESCIFGVDRTPLRQRLGQAFSDAGVRPEIRVEVTTAHAAAALVAHGVGIFVGPRLSYDYSHGERVRMVPFRPRVAAKLAVLFPANRPPNGIAAEFIDAYANAAGHWQST